MMKILVLPIILLQALVSSEACSRNECLISQVITDSVLADHGSKISSGVLTMNGTTSVLRTNNESEFEIKSELNINKTVTSNCPSLENGNNLKQSELIERLTAPCRYDRLERPSVDGGKPVEIHARTYVYLLHSIGKSYQFTVQAMLQLRYIDPRLAFQRVAPERREAIQGGAEFRDLIWVPHLFFANEQDSSVLGTLEEDELTTIGPDGTVLLSTRIQATLFCAVHFNRFPFDEQICTTTIESWMYNSSDLVLSWEENSPIKFNPNMPFTNYELDKYWHNTSLQNPLESNIWHGRSVGNYSSISFTIHLVHTASYYVMCYFIPCMIMVSISWVSFWLCADQTPARTNIGCTTMLSLITLSASELRNSSSFLTILEIWFLGCVIFIFCSLVEFAFSNTIHRRKKVVQMRKVNSKNILKSTVATKKRFRPKSLNDSSSTIDCIEFTARPTVYTTSASVNSIEAAPSSPSIASSMDQSMAESYENAASAKQTFATMTPQEISEWLDKRARFLFPCAFIIFNVFFWMFVLVL